MTAERKARGWSKAVLKGDAVTKEGHEGGRERQFVSSLPLESPREWIAWGGKTGKTQYGWHPVFKPSSCFSFMSFTRGKERRGSRHVETMKTCIFQNTKYTVYTFQRIKAGRPPLLLLPSRRSPPFPYLRTLPPSRRRDPNLLGLRLPRAREAPSQSRSTPTTSSKHEP